MALADLLKEVMTEHGLSHRRVARLSGVAPSTVQGLVTGATTYEKPIRNLYALSGVLGVSVEEMCAEILGIKEEDENG